MTDQYVEDLKERVEGTNPAADQPQFDNYFGFEERERWYFPDGKQWIEFKRMTEGDRARFDSKTNRDVVVQRSSGDARFKLDPGQERRVLIELAVTDWYMVRPGRTSGDWEPVPFSNKPPGGTFDQWYDAANPQLIQELEKAIRKVNPWLTADMTVEDIDKQIEELQQMREDVIRRDVGEASSASK